MTTAEIKARLERMFAAHREPPTGAVVFVGRPTEGSAQQEWRRLQRRVTQYGLRVPSEADAEAVAAVVTDNVLDGLCSPQEAAVLQQLRDARTPLLSVAEAQRQWPGASLDAVDAAYAA